MQKHSEGESWDKQKTKQNKAKKKKKKAKKQNQTTASIGKNICYLRAKKTHNPSVSLLSRTKHLAWNWLVETFS